MALPHYSRDHFTKRIPNRRIGCRQIMLDKLMQARQSMKGHKGEHVMFHVIIHVPINPTADGIHIDRSTIQSMINQTHLPLKWVIVNDGSTDSTAVIVRKYLPAHDWMESLRSMVSVPAEDPKGVPSIVSRTYSSSLVWKRAGCIDPIAVMMILCGSLVPMAK